MKGVLRKAQKKDLLKRLTPIVGEYLIEYEEKTRWTNKEISEYVGVHQQRLSECKHWNGKVIISENSLIKLVARGIVSVKKLKNRLELSPEEESYLDGISAVESEKLRHSLLQLQHAGIDVAALLVKIKKAENTGVDVDYLLDKAIKGKEKG